MMSKAKPEKMWCVRCGIKDRFYLMLGTMSYWRTDSIKKYLAQYDPVDPKIAKQYANWKYWYEKGYRCVRVSVEEIIK